MKRLRIFSATRFDEIKFWRHTKLGLSLKRLSFDPRIRAEILCCNTQGLPVLYNQAVQRTEPKEALLLVHDDVWLDDYHLSTRIEEGLQLFDVLGVAGCTRIPERHVSWCFSQARGSGELIKLEDHYLSGAVGHFRTEGEVISRYGPAPQECKLLDGCLMAMKPATGRERGVSFDERFAFHFYYLDFCRSCHVAELRLGTWPIAITHASGGSFGSPQWQIALQQYRNKWEGET